MRYFVQIIRVPTKNLRKYFPDHTEYLRSQEFDPVITKFLKSHRLLIKNRVLVNSQMARDLDLKMTLKPRFDSHGQNDPLKGNFEEFPSLSSADPKPDNLQQKLENSGKFIFQPGPEKFNFKNFKNLIEYKKFREVFLKKMKIGYVKIDLARNTHSVHNKKYEKIEILSQKKRNRYTTVVRGLEPLFPDLKKVSRYLQKFLATSVSLQSARFKKKDVATLSVQGTMHVQVKNFLVERLGLEDELLELVIRIDKKREKKTGGFVSKKKCSGAH